jgi:hypothetical protein
MIHASSRLDLVIERCELASSMGARRPRINRQSRRAPPLDPAVASRGLVRHVLEIDPSDVVYVKSLIEASEGIASIFAVSGGTLTIATPSTRAAELEVLLGDVFAELSRASRPVRWHRPGDVLGTERVVEPVAEGVDCA